MTSVERWRIQGSFTTTAPLHIGSGDVTEHEKLLNEKNKSASGVQAIVKDFEGKPCIPGTSLKGVLRAWAEKFLPHELSRINRIFGQSENDSDAAESGWAEFCASTFTKSGDYQYQDYVPYWNKDSRTGIASHVSIDRYTGAADQGKLFFEEFVPAGVEFGVEINISRLNKEDVSFLLGVLELGSKHVTHPFQFGANGANGWGRVNWQLKSVKLLEALPQEVGENCVGFGYCQTPSNLIPANLECHEPPHVSLDISLKFQGPMLVNDASRVNPEKESNDGKEADFVPLRREDGGVWLPASSFRGVLRGRCEFLLRSLDPRASGDPNAAAGSGPIERLFGKTSQSTRLTIEEFREHDRCKTPRQDFVAIDRFTGGAADGAKFNADYADRPAVTSRMTIDLEGLHEEDVSLLGLALKDICQQRIPLGWGGSKGYGEAKGTLTLKSFAEIPPDWTALNSWQLGQSGDDAGFFVSDALKRLSATERSPIGLAVTSGMNATGQSPNAAAGASPTSETPVFQGTLAFTTTNGKREFSLSYTRKKGGKESVATLKVDEDRIHPEFVKTLETASTTDVDFERDEKNQPYRIRDRGEEWSLPTVTGQPRDGSAATSGAFANPYYFLRMEDRDKFSGELSDRKPIGHARYHDELYSGRLRVRLTIKTPLLLCENEAQAGVETTPNGEHRVYGVRKDENGKPELPSSSVRGMLRSAYEAITNSRMGVFPAKAQERNVEKRANARRLGYRMNAADGLGLVPVRIDQGKAFLMLGTNPGLPSLNKNNGRWSLPNDLLHAAWVPQYIKDQGASATAIKVGGKPISHGQVACCLLEKMKHHQPNFVFWRVREAAESENLLSPNDALPSPRSEKYSSLNEFIRREGFFVVSNQNIKNKHDERFFFEDSSCPATLDASVLKNYGDLIKDSQNIHKTQLEARLQKNQTPTLYTPSRPARGNRSKSPEIAAMSRHTYNQEELGETGPILCYGSVENTAGVYVVKALYPVMISRKLYQRSPLELLPSKLHPARSLDELSPADRVFGWVSQDENRTPEKNAPAHRSQVSIGTITCQTDAEQAIEEFAIPKILAILGQPKPQQGRFYLGGPDGKAQPVGISKERAGYGPENRIRGPKVYPHHALGIIETEAFSKEASNQNRSVKGWVKPGTEFEFDIRFCNLSVFELGALRWLLTLEDEHFLRLGLGKPLGFGSVRLELLHSESEIATGASLVGSLFESSPGLDRHVLEDISASFVKEMKTASPDLLDAFLKAAKGFENLPIHYPRTAEQKGGDGEHFKWFAENEKAGTALPDLNEDVALRVL